MALSRANAAFPFFGLPPEIRRIIQELVFIKKRRSNNGDLHLSLTCERMYKELECIRNRSMQVCLEDRDKLGLFLTGPPNHLTLRRFVQTITIYFSIPAGNIDSSHNFHRSYGTILNGMALNDKLQHLHIKMMHRCIRGVCSCYTNPVGIITKQGKDTKRSGPEFVTQPMFQSLLELLLELKIPKITFSVLVTSNRLFWSAFDAVNRLEGARRAPGAKVMIFCYAELDWKTMASVLQGARIAPSVWQSP